MVDDRGAYQFYAPSETQFAGFSTSEALRPHEKAVKKIVAEGAKAQQGLPKSVVALGRWVALKLGFAALVELFFLWPEGSIFRLLMGPWFFAPLLHPVAHPFPCGGGKTEKAASQENFNKGLERNYELHPTTLFRRPTTAVR